MADPVLLCRADAGSTMGTGHVLRCLALGQAWQDQGGRVIFAIANCPEFLRERLLANDCSVETLAVEPGSPEEATLTANIARNQAADWVALDGYHFSGPYQRQLKNAGVRVLAFDDYGHADFYAADVVLNQNLGADEGLYAHRDARTRLLLGPRYAVMRREFLPQGSSARVVPDVARNILVTLGGADADNVTLKVIRALDSLDAGHLHVLAVVGGANPHAMSLAAAAQNSSQRIAIQRDVADMAVPLHWADIVVAAGGTTCWELCRMGCSALLIALADNQRPVVAALHEAGAGRSIGRYEEVSEERIARELRQLIGSARDRRMMASRGPQIVDGWGATRVIQKLLPDRPVFTLREATADDGRWVWELANEPTVRAGSFRPEAIPWADHERWFAEKLADRQYLFLIAHDADGKAIGYARFTGRIDTAEISIAIAAAVRGRGYGSEIIRRATRRCGAIRLEARIKPENHASRRAFEKAGYVYSHRTEVGGQPADLLRLIGNVETDRLPTSIFS